MREGHLYRQPLQFGDEMKASSNNQQDGLIL
jgi:hypothetical protein